MVVRERKYFEGNQLCDRLTSELQMYADLEKYTRYAVNHKVNIKTYYYTPHELLAVSGTKRPAYLKRIMVIIQQSHGVYEHEYIIKHDWKERDL